MRFTNTHSLSPTFTTANASGMATGHMLGNTGDFGSYIYTGFPVSGANGSQTPFLESDPALGDVDEHSAGNYLNEETILAAAQAAGADAWAAGGVGYWAVRASTACVMPRASSTNVPGRISCARNTTRPRPKNAMERMAHV